ncbi:MAG: hypothetical protein NTY19_41490 [Planctomycetota bacterium]|nr:hypothetical protein [Planctomycetota bacterium]
MTLTPDPTLEIDEVERCRRTRRVLEQTHGDLGGLCDWIETLQQLRTTKRPPPVGGKSKPISSQAARKR